MQHPGIRACCTGSPFSFWAAQHERLSVGEMVADHIRQDNARALNQPPESLLFTMAKEPMRSAMRVLQVSDELI
jgi:hypothetical protein